MTKLYDLGPPSKPYEPDGPWEEGRFVICPSCGQAVDMRDIRQVAWHQRPVHKPLEMIFDPNFDRDLLKLAP